MARTISTTASGAVHSVRSACWLMLVDIAVRTTPGDSSNASTPCGAPAAAIAPPRRNSAALLAAYAA